jgi:Uncharacterized protein affecting Mg2+/Co2+ transport
MTKQITKGIKISVKTAYDGAMYRDSKLHHIFTYVISIENKSRDTVKLTDRFWTIYDALYAVDFVSGEGVVGQTPTLKPNDVYTYTSGCILNSEAGAMKGFYTMINTETFKQFKVKIPTFQLTSTALLN